jgi:hypothetical protein
MPKIRSLSDRPKYFCAFIIIAFYALSINAQAPSRDLFNIVFENNFEDNQTGDYQSQDFYRDWVNPDAILRNTTVDIIQENSNKFMRGYYPSGSLSPHEGGYLWESDIAGQQNEIYFSYDIRFKPGFQWVMGGKMQVLQAATHRQGLSLLSMMALRSGLCGDPTVIFRCMYTIMTRQ